LPQSGRIFLIGDLAAEDRFLKMFKPDLSAAKRKRTKPA
jgi:hypothetical protein